MIIRLLLVMGCCTYIFSCSSGKALQETQDMDLIAQVLKNYEPDLRYCISLTGKNEGFDCNFTLLPSGLVLSQKVTTKNNNTNETTRCMENIIGHVIFPPVKDKKAKQIKRELTFSEIK